MKNRKGFSLKVTDPETASAILGTGHGKSPAAGRLRADLETADELDRILRLGRAAGAGAGEPDRGDLEHEDDEGEQ